MQNFAYLADMDTTPIRALDDMLLPGLCDRREVENLPIALTESVSDEVILMYALHHNNDAARILVFEPTEQGIVEPVIRKIALGRRQRVGRLQRIIDDDKIA